MVALPKPGSTGDCLVIKNSRVSISRNTAWNLLGAALPLPVALFCIPVLISSLGVDRFGVLGVAWMVMGYFGLFDFGLGQSTTKMVAEQTAQHRTRALMLNSLLLHTVLGIIGGVIFASLAPFLATRVFAVPPGLVGETTSALYWLAASVPAIVITAALRGMLEGFQRFDIVNLVRMPAGILNYAGPVVALGIDNNLPAVVAIIAITRFTVFISYAIACMRLMPPSTGKTRIESAILTRLASYGGWLTVSNFVNPMIIVADRFVIASAVSVTAVTFYVTPYEVITKTWILSASVLGALFPVFSALAASNPGALRGICRTATGQLLVVATPVVAVLLTSSDLLLNLWLGPEFRHHSTIIAHWLAAGILVNIVAQVPLTALNAMGRADMTAKIAAIELPIYVAAIWYGAGKFGIAGVAGIWAVRAAIDAILLIAAANLVLPRTTVEEAGSLTPSTIATFVFFLTAFWLIGTLLTEHWAARFTLTGILFAALLIWEWRGLVTSRDKQSLKTLWRNLTNQGSM
jgi:O-antigen/teichoic acid export membrane protein